MSSGGKRRGFTALEYFSSPIRNTAKSSRTGTRDLIRRRGGFKAASTSFLAAHGYREVSAKYKIAFFCRHSIFSALLAAQEIDDPGEIGAFVPHGVEQRIELGGLRAERSGSAGALGGFLCQSQILEQVISYQELLESCFYLVRSCSMMGQ